ncbi:DUF6892 domain-containing protein [Streptococcus oralis]|uniref:DUF6892 domain-containing protein n=1 Tax=Streptococcus oralis TaxID=1303 RepID=UPI003AF1F7E1
MKFNTCFILKNAHHFSAKNKFNSLVSVVNFFIEVIQESYIQDDSFDLNEVSLKELQQFPNLKKATIMTSNFEQVEDIFKSQGIKVELL